MDIDKFAEEMIISQQEGILSDYCREHWDEMLDYMPNQNNDMDMLIELASRISNSRNIESLEKYREFVAEIKRKGGKNENGIFKSNCINQESFRKNAKLSISIL